MNDRVQDFLPPAEESPSRPRQLGFASFVFDTGREELTRDGVVLPIAPKPLALLRYFLQRPQRVLGKQELMAAIWRQTVVTDDSLVQLVLELRTALGDREQHIVKTVPRRGYLFDAPVQPVAQPSDATGTARQRSWGIPLSAAALICALGGALLWFTQSHSPYSIDEALASRFSVFVAPLVEDDANGEPSQFGRRIAGDISSQLLVAKTRVLTPEQGAKFVVSGRVLRRNGDGIRIETLLRDLSTGDTYPLVQHSFASEEEAIRSDLAVGVVRVMGNRRDEIILAQARRPGHEPDALELVHLGWNELYLSKTDADIWHADAFFEEALRKDPTSFLASLGVASTCQGHFVRLYSARPGQDLAACEQRIARLFASAPENPEAMNAAAFVLLVHGRVDEAELLLRKSLKLSTAPRVGNRLMALVLIREGRFDEAAPYLESMRSWAERGREHGLVDHRMQAANYEVLAEAAFLRGDDDQAYGWLHRWATEMPLNGKPYLMLAAIDALKGRAEQAQAEMKRHRELLPHSNMGYVAMLYPPSTPATAVQAARLLEGMRKAGLPEGAS
jgi:DNA-binding winged helix-turn-helix (wHTH) protein/Flp pilus assembly protein TadD